MNARWCRRTGIEFEREVHRRLAAVFGDRQVRRILQRPGAMAVPDVLAPGLIVECKAGKATNPRAALRQAVREAHGRRGVPIAICKDDRQRAIVTMHFDDFVALLREWFEQRLE
jgi:hypothetical protein